MYICKYQEVLKHVIMYMSQICNQHILQTLFLFQGQSIRLWNEGIKVTVEEDIRWKFCHIKSSNLLPNIMIKNKINEQGYQEAILVREGNCNGKGVIQISLW